MKIKKAFMLISLNAFFLILGLIISAAVFVPLRVRMKSKAWLAMLWARHSCSILGIHIDCTGSYQKDNAYLIVSNHCSYLDILVLAGVMPLVFVSKKEVSSWFILGWLARLAGTIFIDRGSKASTINVIGEIRKRMEYGVNVVFFPEGTTNDGKAVKGFKSALFKVPVEIRCPILPVSLSYSYSEGLPVNETNKIAWYGDMKFLPHLWKLLGIKRIIARIYFNPAISCVQTLERSRARKLLSGYAHESILTGLEYLRGESSS